MRILLVHPGPAFSVADCHTGFYNALRRIDGVQAVSFNLGDRLDALAAAHVQTVGGDWRKAFSDAAVARISAQSLLGDLFTFRPDVLFFTSAFFIPFDTLDVIRGHGIKVVIHHTEEPYESDVNLERALHADLNLLNDPTHIDRFPNAVYQPHCYDPAVHCRRPVKSPDHVSDFVFVGTGYPSRIEFFEQVDFDGIDVALAGNWNTLDKDSPLRKYVAHDIDKCLDNDLAVDLYNATKASVNLYRREANRPELEAGWSMGPREVELAAIGVPFLRERRGEGDDVLSMLPTFDGPDDFGRKLRELIGDDVARDAMAAAAYEAVKDRTFDNAAVRLLTLL